MSKLHHRYAGILRHLRKCQQLLIECLSFCPASRITCLNMEAYEPHSSGEHPSEAARGRPLSIPLHTPTDTREPCAFSILGTESLELEITVSFRRLHSRSISSLAGSFLFQAKIIQCELFRKYAYFHLVNRQLVEAADRIGSAPMAPVSPTPLLYSLLKRDDDTGVASSCDDLTSPCIEVVCAWPLSGQYGFGQRIL